jgi:hypothetical protein
VAFPLLVDPIRRDDACLLSDGAGAVLVMSAERERQLRVPTAVPILGFGAGQTSYDLPGRASLTSSEAVRSGRTAFDMAGVTVRDVDVGQLYDCFTITTWPRDVGAGASPGRGPSASARRCRRSRGRPRDRGPLHQAQRHPPERVWWCIRGVRSLEITKVHRLQGTAFAMVRVFVADSIHRLFPKRAIEHNKLLALTFQYGGSAVEHMHQRTTIELADIVVSRHLGCAVGAPIAKILRQTYGADRRLSYAGLSWYRGDAFEMDITRPRALVEESATALIAPKMRAKKPSA